MVHHASQHMALGFGLGLRPAHYAHILEHKPVVDFFEIISENFMDTDGRPKRKLAQFREHYPIVMHGVSLSIGTCDALNSEYLRKLKALKKWLNPAWISDHLCWTGIAHKNTHDLLPVPYTDEALKHIVQRIKQVQDFLGCRIALENPSTYLEFKTSHIPEAEFIAEMAKQADCNLLLDLNNVYVSCYNHRLDAKAYLDALPLDRVNQIHLSGHSHMGTHIIDTHDAAVIDDVWALYAYTLQKTARRINTMVEWDDHIPEFPVLEVELDKAKAIASRIATNTHSIPDLPNLAAPRIAYRANIQTTLRDTQQYMQDGIFVGNAAKETAHTWIPDKESFPASEQLAVYINAYRYRLYGAVAEDFPVLKHALGSAAYESCLDDFVNQTQSTSFNLAHYSSLLPDFLAQHSGATPFALELAKLENAIAQLADATETTALTPEHLSGLTPEHFMDMRLYPRKALQLFSFAYPVNHFYCAVKEREEGDVPIPLPHAEPSFLAVFRHEDLVWRMDLKEKEYQLLTVLFSGVSVGNALEHAQKTFASEDGDATLAPQLSNWFARWMRNGLLATLHDHTRNPTGNTHAT